MCHMICDTLTREVSVSRLTRSFLSMLNVYYPPPYLLIRILLREKQSCLEARKTCQSQLHSSPRVTEVLNTTHGQ